MKEQIQKLSQAIVAFDRPSAEAILASAMAEHSDAFIQKIREKGLFRTARYGFKSELVARLGDAALRLGNSSLSTQSQNYLRSVLALAELAPAVRMRLKKIQEFINPKLFKTFLVTTDSLFRRRHQKTYAEKLSSWRNFYLEELADAFSYYVALLREKSTLTVPDLNYLVEPRICSDFYLEKLGTLAAIIRFREAEILIDSFPYSATTSNRETQIHAIVPEFEKCVRWGWIRVYSQRQADQLQDDASHIATVEDFAKEFVNSGHERCFEILNGKYARIRFHIPLIHEFIKAFRETGVFREDYFLLQDAAKSLFVNYDQILGTQIHKSITLFDMIKFRRLCIFLQLSLDEFCRRKNLLNTATYYRSLAIHLTEKEGLAWLRTLCAVENPEHLFEILSRPADSTAVFDIQYTPILRMAGQFLIPVAVAASSNIIRNSLQASRFRFDDTGEVDPVGDQIRADLAEVGVKAISRISYAFEGEKGEIDVLAQIGNHTFAFECKNSLNPCNVHELRQSYGYILKGFDQLTRLRNLFPNPKFRSQLAKKSGLNVLETSGLTTCVVMGNRMLNGYREHGHSVRSVHELCNFITGGCLNYSFPRNVEEPEGPKTKVRLKSWNGDTFCAADVVNFIEKDCWHESVFQAMVGYDEVIPFGDRSLRYKSFILDSIAYGKLLCENPRAVLEETSNIAF